MKQKELRDITGGLEFPTTIPTLKKFKKKGGGE
jgi:hypothetical protein